ncbi:MAG: AsmA family protein, partial [Wenzhouxiangellaceae bacterium]
DLFQADEFRMSLALLPLLRGEVETGDIGLDNASLTIHTDRAGRSSLNGLVAASGEPQALPDDDRARAPRVSTGAITLSGTRLEISDAATDARQVFVVERLQIDSFAFDQPVRFSFKGEVGDPPSIDGIDVKGMLTVPSGAGAIRVDDLEMTATAAGLPLGLTGRATLDPGPPLVMQFEDGRVDLNGTELAASFSYRDSARPKIDATASGERLNVDALLAVMPESGEAADDAQSPLLLLREFDVDARLELEQMTVAGLDLSNVRTRLSAVNGVVTVDPLAAELEGGRVDAVAMVDLNQQPARVTISPVFDLQSLGQALAPWGLDRFLTGSGVLDMSLEARGLDATEILASLNGGGEYSFSDGSIRGVDLDSMVESLSARNIAEAVRAGTGGQTTFETMQGILEVRDGTIRMPGMRLVTELLGVDGEIRLGLSDLSLGGELSLQNESLGRIPMSLGGSLTDPRLSPDIAGVVREEAGRRVLDALRERGLRRDGDDGDDGNGNGNGNGND